MGNYHWGSDKEEVSKFMSKKKEAYIDLYRFLIDMVFTTYQSFAGYLNIKYF